MTLHTTSTQLVLQYVLELDDYHLTTYVLHQEFEHMLDQEIIQLSKSQRSSPLRVVPKKTPGDPVVITEPLTG